MRTRGPPGCSGGASGGGGDRALRGDGERDCGKRTPVADFREQGRGGKGITLMRVTPRTGNVAGMRHVQGDEDIMLVTAQGMMIRTSASGVGGVGRAPHGGKVH